MAPGVFILKSVVHLPSSDKCCGWYPWPASHNTAICGSHRGEAACKYKLKKKEQFKRYYNGIKTRKCLKNNNKNV